MASSRFGYLLLLVCTISLSFGTTNCKRTSLLTNQAALFVFGDSTFDVGNAEAKRIFSRAVYLIFIGGNDYFYPFTANSSIFRSHTRAQYVDLVIGNITTLIKEVYKVGGRKFGLMNMGRLDCLPAVLTLDPTGSCFKPISELVKLHNEKYSNVLKNLEIELPGFKYSLHDSYASSTEAMENPSKYGFKEVKKACCGSGPYRGFSTCGYRTGMTQNFELCENVNDYMFFDGSHATEKANEQIAKLMWSGTPDITTPYNLKTLFEL